MNSSYFYLNTYGFLISKNFRYKRTAAGVLKGIYSTKDNVSVRTRILTILVMIDKWCFRHR